MSTPTPRNRLVHNIWKLPSHNHRSLAWAVIGVKQPRDQDSLNTHYQQKLYCYNVD